MTPQRPTTRARRPAARPPYARSRPPASRRPSGPSRPRRRPLRLGTLHGRLRFGFAAVCTLLLVIGGRLVQVQGLDHGRYAGAAAAQRVETVPIHAMRGSIVDRDGTPLAYTSAAQDITADPAQIPAASRAAYGAKLAPLLHVSAATVAIALATPGQYVKLASAVPQLTAQKVAGPAHHGDHAGHQGGHH